MNKKPLTTKQKVIIVTAVILGVLAAAYGVLYAIWPVQVKDYTFKVWDWLNQPLPIISLSVVAIVVILFRIFAVSSFGKRKLNELKAFYNELKYEYNNYKKEAENTIANLNKSLDEKDYEIGRLNTIVKKLINATPNKKVKAIGEEYYGEETKEKND